MPLAEGAKVSRLARELDEIDIAEAYAYQGGYELCRETGHVQGFAQVAASVGCTLQTRGKLDEALSY